MNTSCKVKKMKSIEQKLKTDAKAFNKTPSLRVHDTIMQKIKLEKSIKKNDSIFNIKWMIPAGFALTAVLMLTFTASKETLDKTLNSPTHETVHQESMSSNDVDIDLIALNFEIKLINPIKTEQQAIINDIKFLKSLITL